MATAPSPVYRVASGRPVNAGRWPGGRVTGSVNLDDMVLAGVFTGYVGSAYSDPDWVSRKSGASVIAAHAFDYDTEISAHLLAETGAPDHPVPVRRVVDAAGYGCLEQVVIGAGLASAYTAGGTTMLIDDAYLWPDPAVTGPFYFMVAKAYPSTPDKNLFLCTARSGTTLTVAYQGGQGSAFAATAQNYSVGDYAGNENSRDWRRTFAALPAVENGLPTDDPAASGAVPLRSKSATGTYGVPRDASYWQYGWYGHASNQSTWANWTGWIGTTSLTPRGTAQGAAAKYRLWDGDTIYIQFRLKIDPRFFLYHAQPDPATTQYWIRKAFALQSEVSSLNQLVVDLGPATIYDIPATPGTVFRLGTYKDSRVVGATDWARPAAPAAGHVSYQAGSPWDVSPYYADISSSGRPATGCATPDGAAAWKIPDTEWVTFHMKVKPGRSGVAETAIKIEFARQDQAGYTGAYTTVLDVTDAKIIYSGSGDYGYPDGSFSYPTVQRMDALPGYQAFGLMGYLNLFQDAGWVPPKRSYTLRMAQVIFSQAPIPAPALTAINLSGNVWTPNRSGGNVLLTDFPQLPANTWVTVAGSLNKLTDIQPATSYPNSSGSNGWPKIITAWGGAAWDATTYRMLITGGGHGDASSAENGIYAVNCVKMQVETVVTRSDYANRAKVSSGTTLIQGDGWPAGQNYPTLDGKWGSQHTYYGLVHIPTATMTALGLGSPVKGGLFMPGHARAVVNLDSGAYSKVWWKTSAPDDSYQTWVRYGTKLIWPRNSFSFARWDMTQTETTDWATSGQDPAPGTPSFGKDLTAASSGSNFVYNSRTFCDLAERNEMISFAASHQRVRYGAAEAAAATDWTSYQETLTLTGTDAADLNTSGNYTDSGTNLLNGAGASYLHSSGEVFVFPNTSGNQVYRITGLTSGTTGTVTKLGAGSALLTTSTLGTFGRARVFEYAGCKLAVRVSDTANPIEVMRIV